MSPAMRSYADHSPSFAECRETSLIVGKHSVSRALRRSCYIIPYPAAANVSAAVSATSTATVLVKVSKC